MAQNRQFYVLSAIPTSANVDKLELDDIGVFNGVVYTCTNPTSGSATFKKIKSTESNYIIISANYTTDTNNEVIEVDTANVIITLLNPINNVGLKCTIINSSNGNITVNNVENESFILYSKEILDIVSNNLIWKLI